MKMNITRLLGTILFGLSLSNVYAFGGAASAQPMIDYTGYVLHGSGPFSNSAATAIVTRLGNDRFRLALTAEHLPPPAILRATFARHAYIAWLVNGTVMHGPLHMAAVGLSATGGVGNYAGQGIVVISGVTSVIITAEPAAHAHMPIMPVLTVLASAGHQM
jgi:hypothetical protein